MSEIGGVNVLKTVFTNPSCKVFYLPQQLAGNNFRLRVPPRFERLKARSELKFEAPLPHPSHTVTSTLPRWLAMMLAIAAGLAACGDQLTPPTREASHLAPTTASRWINQDFPDYSGEDGFSCQAHLGDDPAACLNISTHVDSALTSGGLTRNVVTFSRPVSRVDRVYKALPDQIWCYLIDRIPLERPGTLQPSRVPSAQKDRVADLMGSAPPRLAKPQGRPSTVLGPWPGPPYIVCNRQLYPETHGVAFNAAGDVVASADNEADTSGPNSDGSLSNNWLQLASSHNDIVRVEFTTPTPSDWTLDYAVFAGTPVSSFTISCQPQAPRRGTAVHCVLMMSDSSEFTLKHLKTTSGGQGIVDGDVDQTGTRVDFAGPAVVPTHVRADVIAGGTPMFAEADFTITPRTFTDNASTQVANPPILKAPGPPIMMAPYPGWFDTVGTTGFRKGGVGMTWHLEPTFNAGIVPRGPNQGVAFITHFEWVKPVPKAGADSIADGIYLSSALFPGDPAHDIQDGKQGYCGPQDMTVLRNELYAHELNHRALEIRLREQAKLHDVYEGLFVLNAADQDAAVAKLRLPIATFRDERDAADEATDTDASTAFKTSITCVLRIPK
ncbi:MAG: hypothetical protein ABI601_05490 [bacterium]